MTAPDADLTTVMSSILPPRLSDATFLYWDSLPPAIQRDYNSVKEKLHVGHITPFQFIRHMLMLALANQVRV